MREKVRDKWISELAGNLKEWARCFFFFSEKLFYTTAFSSINIWNKIETWNNLFHKKNFTYRGYIF